jgi:hypothetical protein
MTTKKIQNFKWYTAVAFKAWIKICDENYLEDQNLLKNIMGTKDEILYINFKIFTDSIFNTILYNTTI